MNLNKITKKDLYEEFLNEVDKRQELERLYYNLELQNEKIIKEKLSSQESSMRFKSELNDKSKQLDYLNLERIADLKTFKDHLLATTSCHTHRQKNNLSIHLMDVVEAKIQNLIRSLKWINDKNLPF